MIIVTDDQFCFIPIYPADYGLKHDHIKTSARSIVTINGSRKRTINGDNFSSDIASFERRFLSSVIRNETTIFRMPPVETTLFQTKVVFHEKS